MELTYIHALEELRDLRIINLGTLSGTLLHIA